MGDRWIGWTAEDCRWELREALATVRPHATLSFASSASDLRRRLRFEDEEAFGAIVGLSEEGVSDMNLAAAIARDGMAGEVILVTRHASGSLRSRAAQAGIGMVIDMSEVDAATGEPGTVGRAGGARGLPDIPVAAEEAMADDVPFDLDEPEDSTGSSQLGVRVGADLPTGRRGVTLTFASGRGGVGKTTLVAACAAIAGTWGMRVAVVDLDLSCGNLYVAFGVGRPVDLSRIGGRAPATREVMGRSCARLADDVYLWGPCDRPEMAEEVMPQVGRLLEYLSQRYDLVLVDTSTTFTDAVAEAVQRADRVILVHDEAPGSIGSVGRASSLVVRLGVARTRLVRVCNVADPRQREVVSQIAPAGALEGAQSFRVLDGGFEVAEVAAAGGMSTLVEADGPMVSSARSMLARILAELGALPDVEDAQRAARDTARRERFRFFSRRRETV
ncbi:MAG: CpaE family protein [Parafannyhessea sp.]|uniref:AAA family ATPase n=1 Tax=Parafannyhessea sp. TaxID=2847324 RepID=UPI003F02280A